MKERGDEEKKNGHRNEIKEKGNWIKGNGIRKEQKERDQEESKKRKM